MPTVRSPLSRPPSLLGVSFRGAEATGPTYCFRQALGLVPKRLLNQREKVPTEEKPSRSATSVRERSEPPT